MWQFTQSIGSSLDHAYLLAAMAICAFGSVGTIVIADRVPGRRRQLWIALVGACGSATVWSTQFIAVLAYRPEFPMSFEPYRMAGSLLAGIAPLAAGTAIAMSAGGRGRLIALGGCLIGGGIAVQHYLGTAAVRIPGVLVREHTLVGLSVIGSMVLGVLVAWLLARRGRLADRAMSALALALLIVWMHTTAMGSLTVEFGYWTRDSVDSLSRETLASVTIASAGLVISLGLVGALFDRRRATDLHKQAHRFQLLSDSALEALIVHRDGCVVDANAAARRLLSLDPFPKGGSLFALVDGLTSDALEPRDEPLEVNLTAIDGRRFAAEVRGQPILLVDGTPAQVLAIRDISARKQAELRLAHQALHDPLTNLPNRRLTEELIERMREQAAQSAGRFAVLVVDVDNLKTINDIHGYAAGDRALQAVARQISERLGDGDVLGRLEGDGYVVATAARNQPHDSLIFAEQLLKRAALPIEGEGTLTTLSISIGIAVYPDDGRNAADLVRNAGTAMYRAKSDGRGVVRFFEPKMNAALEARRALEGRLRRAIAEGQLTVAYQPVVDSRSRRTMGFEALARWTDEKLGSVSPGAFITVAEDTGLIIPLGEQVLRTACRDAMTWPRPLWVAVNLSAAQFSDPKLVEKIEGILRETGLPGERLTLEITESILIDSRQRVLQVLTELKRLGVSIAMDDFGTGYSSLSYLQSFSFDKIKIDRSFVSGLADGSQNLSIISAMVALGRSLDMRVVAEGVETPAQAHQLRDMACHELQGFLIARPMPASAVQAYMHRDLSIVAVS